MQIPSNHPDYVCHETNATEEPGGSVVSKASEEVPADCKEGKRYTLEGMIPILGGRLPYNCEVIDYTKQMNVTSGTSIKRAVEGQKELIDDPVYKVTCGTHLLRSDRPFLQPGFDTLTPASFYYLGSDQITFRQVSPEVIEIYEHDIRGEECKQYVDTSFEYVDENGQAYYFVYSYCPEEISKEKAWEKFNQFKEAKSADTLRCIYNRFGVFIEVAYKLPPYDFFFYELYGSRPREDFFTKCHFSDFFRVLILTKSQVKAEENPEFALNYLKEHDPEYITAITPQKKRLWGQKKEPLNEEKLMKQFRRSKIKNTPEAYYGDLKNCDPIITNHLSENSRSIIPIINGVAAHILIQRNDFSLPAVLSSRPEIPDKAEASDKNPEKILAEIQNFLKS